MLCSCGERAHDGHHLCRRCLRDSMPRDQWPDVLATGNGLWVEHGIARHALLTRGVKYGARVRVHDLAYVGSRPFEFTREADRTLLGFPRCGGVVLGDDVEIFPFTNVDAGFLGDTVVGRGTKIDHHCHIGHNAQVGEDCLICAGTILGGHVVVGDGAFLGIGVEVKPRVTIGARAVVGMGAVVLADVPDYARVAGVPAHALDVPSRWDGEEWLHRAE